MTFKNKNEITSCNLTKLDHSRNTGVSNQAIFSNTSFLPASSKYACYKRFEVLDKVLKIVIACFLKDKV